MSLPNPLDPSQSNYSHLENLACGYWGSEVFFTTLNLDLFSKLGAGTNDLTVFATENNFDQHGVQRLFQALQQLGLVEHENGYWFPTVISRTYLDKTSPDCMIDFFLYRQYMQEGWHNLTHKIGTVPQPKITPKSCYTERNFYYVKALDLLAKQKGAEIVGIVKECNWQGEILDIGGGAGSLCRAFLTERPDQSSTVFDLAEVHDAARKIYPSPSDWENINYIEGDFVTHHFAADKKYGLILMANFLHAYDNQTGQNLLQKGCSLLAEDGILIIHDYFPDRQTDRSTKAVLYDLHMLSSTYNGACHRSSEIHSWLRDLDIQQIETIDLANDSSLIIASPTAPLTFGINWQQIAKDHGFRTGILLSPDEIRTAPWVALKCQFGCQKFAQSQQCPPFSMDEAKTRKLLDSYSQCLLVESTPPGAQFHQQLLELERTAFLNGNHKAFVLGAGPCTLCPTCDTSKPCLHPEKARPAMEACGIDVYGTMEKAGMQLTPLKDKNQYVKYVGLLLIE